MIRHLFLALALFAGVSSAAQAQNAKIVATCGAQALRVNDASALFMDATGTLCTLAGGGGSGGTVTQGAAASDTAVNRWPVLAYQGGTWTFGLSGPIPTGTNTIGSIANINGTISLPTGAATAANQSTEITALQSLVAGAKIFSAFPAPETVTPLAANGQWTGAPHNSGQINSNAYFAYVTATFFSDQAGTAFLEQSLDSTNWYPLNGTAGTAVAAGASVVVKAPATMNLYRARFTNGATAQTKFAVGSMFSAF